MERKSHHVLRHRFERFSIAGSEIQSSLGCRAGSAPESIIDDGFLKGLILATDYHSQLSYRPGLPSQILLSPLLSIAVGMISLQKNDKRMNSTDTDTQTCSACKYWNDKSQGEGECRVRAPQTMVFKVDEETQFETRFPVTKAEDWCGEFEKA